MTFIFNETTTPNKNHNDINHSNYNGEDAQWLFSKTLTEVAICFEQLLKLIPDN